MDFFGGVFQSLTATFIAMLGGLVLALLKKRASPWLAPICWFIGGTTVILIAIGISRLAMYPFPDVGVRITPDTARTVLRGYTDSLHLGEQPLPDEPSRIFAMTVID